MIDWQPSSPGLQRAHHVCHIWVCCILEKHQSIFRATEHVTVCFPPLSAPRLFEQNRWQSSPLWLSLERTPSTFLSDNQPTQFTQMYNPKQLKHGLRFSSCTEGPSVLNKGTCLVPLPTQLGEAPKDTRGPESHASAVNHDCLATNAGLEQAHHLRQRGLRCLCVYFGHKNFAARIYKLAAQTHAN